MPLPNKIREVGPRPVGEQFSEGRQDFSIVLGGPIFGLLFKLHLTGTELELLPRRLLVITAVAWLPLLLLTTFTPSIHGAAAFLRDVEAQVRFLIALPVLIIAEMIVHSRLSPVVRRFVELEIIPPRDLPKFYRSVESALALRNSSFIEFALLLIVYTFGTFITLNRIVGTTTWYSVPSARWHLTPAGFWYVFVSIPIVQFLLLRWYARLLIWYRFLWQVSRLDLHLIPSHPDRSAGLSFLGRSAYAFSPIVFAEGALIAGLVASQILYRGANLLSFKWEIGAVISFFVLILLAPLTMFTPRMARTKRKGLFEYGLFAQRYVDGFQKKWISGEKATDEDPLGASDIQSLADLGNSYDLVRDMRLFPFGLQDVSRLTAAAVTPLLPLLLTIFSPEEILVRIMRVVF